MTRKDYVRLAAGFASVEPFPEAQQRHLQWEIGIHEIARVLAADNPRFDRERFLEACEQGGIKPRSKMQC